MDAWSMHDFLDHHLHTHVSSHFDGAVRDVPLWTNLWGMSNLLNDLLHWHVHNHRHFTCDFLLLPDSWSMHHFLDRLWC